MRISNHELLAAGVCVWIVSVAATPAVCQQPPEPTDVTPLDGEVYYMLNQFSGLQAAAAGGSFNSRGASRIWASDGRLQTWVADIGRLVTSAMACASTQPDRRLSTG